MDDLKRMLETEDGTARMVGECLEAARASAGVIVFGAGVGGAALYGLLKENGLEHKILCFSDNNEMKFHKAYCEGRLAVQPPCGLVGLYGKSPSVLVASSAYDKIKRQLVSYGFDERRVYLFNFAFMDLHHTDRDFIFSHIGDFSRAYGRLADGKSRRIFTAILNYRITKRERFLEQMQPDVDDERRQYFAGDLFSFRQDEVLLDVGAYVGDTLKAYQEAYGQWKGYIGLEADGMVFARLGEYVARSGLCPRARLINAAAWDREETLQIAQNPGSSRMSGGEGSQGVAGDTVDRMLQGEAVTFVKMDIEGAEYKAILGMQQTIRRNKPVMAVCVYHLRDDFYRLTDLIEQTLPGEYTFYFRQYRYTPTETVCYAVPRHRLKA